MDTQLLRRRLLDFLEEDLGRGDVTSEAVVSEEAGARGRVIVQAAGIVAGIREAVVLADLVAASATFERRDGEPVEPGDVVLVVEGSAWAVLGVERTLLNVVGHMSGIATLARRAVEATGDTGVRIAATRKTLPGLRWLQKRAVRLGGADPHRLDLSGAVLIKDNHLVVVGDVAEAVRRARERASFTASIEVEVESLEEALAAARAGADVLLLDNLSPAAIREIVVGLNSEGLRERLTLEASGGIRIDDVYAYAESGVDVVSLGALTTAATSLDCSLEIEPLRGRA